MKSSRGGVGAWLRWSTAINSTHDSATEFLSGRRPNSRPHKGLTNEESGLPGTADSGKKFFTFSREG